MSVEDGHGLREGTVAKQAFDSAMSAHADLGSDGIALHEDTTRGFREVVESLSGKDIASFQVLVLYRQPNSSADGKAVYLQGGGGGVPDTFLRPMISLAWAQVARMEATLREVTEGEVAAQVAEAGTK